MSDWKERKTNPEGLSDAALELLSDEELFDADDFLAEYTAAQVSDLTGAPSPKAEPAPRRGQQSPPPAEEADPAEDEGEEDEEPEVDAPPRKKAPRAAKPSKERNRGLGVGIRHVLLNAVELLLILFLASYVVWIFLKDTSKDVDMEDIAVTVAQQCQLGDLQEGDANTLKRYFSLDGAEYEGYIVYTADSVMNVDELLIVKVSDSSQLNTLETVVNNRLEEQIHNFDGYGTNQSELLQNAIILERGDYFFYGVSENVEQWEDVFLSCIK